MPAGRISSTPFKIGIDIILVILIYYVSSYVSVVHVITNWNLSSVFLLFLLVFLWVLISVSVGLYDEFRARNFTYEVIALIKCIIPQGLLIIVFSFMFVEISISRIFLLIYLCLLLSVFLAEKYFVRTILQLLRTKGRNLRFILIVGAGEVGESFYSVIKENAQFGYHTIGFIDDHEKTMCNGLFLGKINKLDEILSTKIVDDVIIALPNYAEERIQWVVNTCAKYPIHVKIIPDYFKFAINSQYHISMFDRFPILSLREDKINKIHWRFLKRGFDILFSLFVFLFILSWLYPIIAGIIKVTSKGPVLFKQERWGRKNKKFIAYKFRTMIFDAKDNDQTGKYQFATRDDPRITSIGEVLRKTNLDELPQFWNVLKGEMSLIGPRPHPSPLNTEVKDNIRQYLLRHLVKPGLSGWAQVNGLRGQANQLGVMQNRVNYDIWYIENWSFALDLQIIFLTIWKMIKGDPHAY